jgi:hypothetical protein
VAVLWEHECRDPSGFANKSKDGELLTDGKWFLGIVTRLLHQQGSFIVSYDDGTHRLTRAGPDDLEDSYDWVIYTDDPAPEYEFNSRVTQLHNAETKEKLLGITAVLSAATDLELEATDPELEPPLMEGMEQRVVLQQRWNPTRDARQNPQATLAAEQAAAVATAFAAAAAARGSKTKQIQADKKRKSEWQAREPDILAGSVDMVKLRAVQKLLAEAWPGVMDLLTLGNDSFSNDMLFGLCTTGIPLSEAVSNCVAVLKFTDGDMAALPAKLGHDKHKLDDWLKQNLRGLRADVVRQISCALSRECHATIVSAENLVHRGLLEDARKELRCGIMGCGTKQASMAVEFGALRLALRNDTYRVLQPLEAPVDCNLTTLLGRLGVFKDSLLPAFSIQCTLTALDRLHFAVLQEGHSRMDYTTGVQYDFEAGQLVLLQLVGQVVGNVVAVRQRRWYSLPVSGSHVIKERPAGLFKHDAHDVGGFDNLDPHYKRQAIAGVGFLNKASGTHDDVDGGDEVDKHSAAPLQDQEPQQQGAARGRGTKGQGEQKASAAGAAKRPRKGQALSDDVLSWANGISAAVTQSQLPQIMQHLLSPALTRLATIEDGVGDTPSGTHTTIGLAGLLMASVFKHNLLIHNRLVCGRQPQCWACVLRPHCDAYTEVKGSASKCCPDIEDMGDLPSVAAARTVRRGKVCRHTGHAAGLSAAATEVLLFNDSNHCLVHPHLGIGRCIPHMSSYWSPACRFEATLDGADVTVVSDDGKGGVTVVSATDERSAFRAAIKMGLLNDLKAMPEVSAAKFASVCSNFVCVAGTCDLSAGRPPLNMGRIRA